jgi:hypothetical protein
VRQQRIMVQHIPRCVKSGAVFRHACRGEERARDDRRPSPSMNGEALERVLKNVRRNSRNAISTIGRSRATRRPCVCPKPRPTRPTLRCRSATTSPSGLSGPRKAQ